MTETECGNLLRKTRKSMGLTIEEMAEHLDVSPTTLSLWERGKSYPDANHRATINSIIGISIPERSAT